MNITPADKCTCGHSYERHAVYAYDGACAAWEDYIDPSDRCMCGRFKLDNLSYIEKLAKERNLI